MKVFKRLSPGNCATLMMTLCAICAVPGFILASTEFDLGGAALGFTVWIGITGYIASRLRFLEVMNDRVWRAGIVAAFFIRTGLAVIFPLGMLIDALSGFIALVIATGLISPWQPLFSMRAESFVTALLTTLAMGAFIAFETFLVALIATQFLNGRRKPSTRCRKCRYDLRGSLNVCRCPECGTMFAPAKIREALVEATHSPT